MLARERQWAGDGPSKVCTECRMYSVQSVSCYIHYSYQHFTGVIKINPNCVPSCLSHAKFILRVNISNQDWSYWEEKTSSKHVFFEYIKFWFNNFAVKQFVCIPQQQNRKCNTFKSLDIQDSQDRIIIVVWNWKSILRWPNYRGQTENVNGVINNAQKVYSSIFVSSLPSRN